MKKLFTLFVIATIALSHSCTESGIENDAMNGNKIKLSATQVEVDFEGETECKITVNSPCSWEAESKNDWLNVVTKQGVAGTKELSFYADDNYDLEKREGTIVVTNRDYGYIDELYVTQKGFVPSIQYPETMTFDSKGGYQNITITANCSWEYSDDASWLTLSRTSSGLKVTATECTSTSERTATITLSNSNYKVSKQIKVTQKAFEPTLEIDKTELNFDVKGGSKTVYVTTNAEFNVSESSSWISCTKSSNRVTITVSASDVTKERTAEIEIYLTDYNVTETVKISQKEFVPEFEVKVSELNFEAEGGNKTLSVTANFDYSVSESASWLSYEKTSGGVKIIADANVDEQERTADVKIYSNTYGKSATVKVTQKKFVPELTIAKTELSFESVGGTQEIAISSNFDYQITSNVDWLTCKKVSNGVSVTASFYDITEDRTAEMTISNAKYNQSKSIKVTQKKFVLEFEVGISELTFEAEGGTQTIPVTANFEYSVSESADWLSYQITSSGVKLTATANVEEKENTAEVKIYSSKYGVTKTVYVKQKKFVPTITIDKTELCFEAKGGMQSFSVSANFEYIVSESIDWLSFEKRGDNIKVAVSNYVEVVERTAEITVSNDKYNIERVVRITQKAFVPTLSIDKSEIEFEFEGGTQIINVTTNANEFDITSSSDWITYSKNGSSIEITANAYSITEDRTADVTIYLPKYNLTQTLIVKQKKFVPSITIYQSELYFEADGNTKQITIKANFDYEVETTVNWISFEKVANGIAIVASQNKYVKTNNRTTEINIYNEQYSIAHSIKIVQYPYKLGDIATINGVKGVVYYADSKTTKIISTVETSANWNDAEAWCNNLEGYWWLPSRSELIEICDNYSVISSTISAKGYTSLKIGSEWYWSSTYDPDNTFWAYKYLVRNGYYKSENPKYYYYVRAVSSF